MARIGFIGAGVMGGPMIGNLVKAGNDVVALGRSEVSRERIRKAGAREAESLSTVSHEVDVVITMVPDSPDVQAIVLQEAGLADLLRPGQVFVDMSTISPAIARTVSQRLGKGGVAALDAPVSGGEQAAVDGTLSIMVGGESTALEAVRPILAAMGSSITHVGPAGSGQLTKAANQLVVAANIQAVAEAIVLLETAGVDLDAALRALSGGLAGSAVLDRKRAAFLSSAFVPGFRVELHDKDLGIVQATAREQSNALPLTATVSQQMAALKARGGGGLDHSALLALTRELNGRVAGAPD